MESPVMMMSNASVVADVSPTISRKTAIVYAGDYLNKASGERVEYECRQYLSYGYKSLVISFRETKVVNSIGISILIGVIEMARETGTDIIFAEPNEQTHSLFEMLGLTRHVSIAKTELDALGAITIG